MERMKLFINGEFVKSKSTVYRQIHDPSTGEIIAETPCCTKEEVLSAVEAARAAFPAWAATPPAKRAQCLFRLRELIAAHFDELTMSVARENGKAWLEAAGDVRKAQEMTELATSVSTQILGDAMLNASHGYDTTLYREPLGVFAGIAPWNFPAMIPMGWMTPLAICCGNTYVLKAATISAIRSSTMSSLG